MILGIIVIFILSLFIRLSIIWSHKDRGCDAYYFLMSSEEYRKNHKLPIVLPEIYTLEEREQWYPPGFSVFLGLLPERIVKKYYWAITPLIDSMLACAAFALGYTAGGFWIGMLVGVAYSINSASIPDTTSLNARHLGAYLFTATMLSLLWAHSEFWFPFSLFLVSSVLLLFTHKLSSQLLYFVLPFMSVVTGEWFYVMALLAAVSLSLVVNYKMMLKIWKGQYDILAFWARNWKLLGAHAIYGSTMYEKKDKDTRRVHIGGIKGIIKSVSYLGLNTFILPALFVIPMHLSDFDKGMVWWVLGTYVWATATQLIPRLRFLGEGYRYLKLAAIPTCYVAALPLIYGQESVLYYAALIVAMIAAIVVIAKLFVFMTDKEGTTIPFLDDKSLLNIIEYIKMQTDVTVLCIPDSLGDAVGYYTKKHVLRGTHNVPFKRVAPFFPVYKLPVEYLIKWYGVTHVIVGKGYADSTELQLTEIGEQVIDGEGYELWERVSRKPNALEVT
jgi:hypothetical protein